MLQAVLNHLFDRISKIKAHEITPPEDLRKLRLSLTVIILLLQKLKSPINYMFLWEAIYMLVFLSRFTEASDRLFQELARYLTRSMRGDRPFVDPDWREMVDDLEGCGLREILEATPPELYLKRRVFDLSQGIFGLQAPQQDPPNISVSIFSSADSHAAVDNPTNLSAWVPSFLKIEYCSLNLIILQSCCADCSKFLNMQQRNRCTVTTFCDLFSPNMKVLCSWVVTLYSVTR